MGDRPIFILGCTKSGTTLMRNLFDGHPELFVVPFESHFFQSIKYWVSYYFRRTAPETLTYEQMKEGLYAWIERSNAIDNPIADGFVTGRWNMEIVKEVLFQDPVKNLTELSDLYVAAIYKGIHGNAISQTVNFVEKSVENAEFVSDILRMYPNARFVHILRNPYSNLVAIRNYAAIQQSGKKSKYPRLKSALLAMHNSYYNLYRNKRLSENYHVIRYEDILKDPQTQMKAIAEFAGIGYDPCLTQPSFLGEPWGGNSTSGRKFSKVSADNIDRWKNEITPFEINMVNKLFPFVLKDFDFDPISNKGSVYTRSKNEGAVNYMYNRLLVNYLPK